MIGLLINNTYAKYREKIDGDAAINVASWDIKINNESISTQVKLTNDIIPLFPGDEYTKANVLAPGVTGYYDIIIDASNVDVSFSYEISANVSDESVVTDLIVTGYSIDNGDIIEYTDSISGIVPYDTDSETVRIYIKWDDENGTMDNRADTLASFDEGNAIVTNSLIFSQIRN